MTYPRLIALFSFCFVFVALATLPLAVVLRVLDPERAGIAYTRVSGTVWDGEIDGLSWRGHDLGSAKVAVRPLPILIARLGADIAFDGGGIVSGGGFVALGPAGIVIDDLTLSTDVAAMPLLLPLTGQVTLTVRHAELSSAGCREIEGAVRTDALVNRPAGLGWSGPVLQGPINCAQGALAIPLTGATSTDSIALALSLGPDGAFGVEVEARTPDSTLLSVLSAVGFIESNGAMTLSQRGRWI